MQSNRSSRPNLRMGRGGPGRMGRTFAFAEKPKEAKKTLKRLSRYLGNNRFLFGGLLVISMILTILALIIPILQGNAIDAIIIRESLTISINDKGYWVINGEEYLKASDMLESSITSTLEVSDNNKWVINDEETIYDAIDPNNSKKYGTAKVDVDGMWIINDEKTTYQANSINIFDNSIVITINELKHWVINQEGTSLWAIGVKDAKLLLKLIITLAIVYAINIIFSFIRGLVSSYLTQYTVRRMRKDLFSKMIRLPIPYFDHNPHGDIMSRVTNDVDNIAMTISQAIASIFSGILTIIGAFGVMVYYSFKLTLIASSTIILSIIVTRIMSKHMRTLFRRNQRLIGELNAQVEEAVTGHRTVAVFSKENDLQTMFNDKSDELRLSYTKAQIVSFSMHPMMNIITNLSFLLIVVFGAYFVYQGIDNMTIGTIIIFTSLSKQFSRPINEIATLYAQIQTAVAAAERVFEVIDTEQEVNEGKLMLNEVWQQGKITFKNVYFSYVLDEPVIQDFNLEIEPGQKIALVGATGSGKTTIVNLLMRFYDIDKGTIMIDGEDIRLIDKSELRKSLAIVLQDTVLFSDTIENNIRYGSFKATTEEVIKASQTSNANLFIERLPDGYQTVLKETATSLSQGERQMISIARAVLANPRILILDEATSSVDTRTEKNIQDAMVALMKNRTSLIIAHRLSTIRDADKIVVIDRGKVVEIGRHEELLALRGRYYDLYRQQFAGNVI